MKTVRVIFKVLKGVAKLVIFLADNDVIDLPKPREKRPRKKKPQPEPEPVPDTTANQLPFEEVKP